MQEFDDVEDVKEGNKIFHTLFSEIKGKNERFKGRKNQEKKY